MKDKSSQNSSKRTVFFTALLLHKRGRKLNPFVMQLEWGAGVLSWPEYADLVCRDLALAWDQDNGLSAQLARKYCQIHSHGYWGNKQMWVAPLFKNGHKITAENEDFPNRQTSQEEAWTCCGTDLDNGSHSWLVTKTWSTRTSNSFGW